MTINDLYKQLTGGGTGSYGDQSEQYQKLLGQQQYGGGYQIYVPPETEQQKQEKSMAIFDETELQTGEARDMRRVSTPQMGQQFDLNRLAVDTVLVVNKLVEEITMLKAEIQVLKLRTEEAPEPAFALTTLASAYGDVAK